MMGCADLIESSRPEREEPFAEIAQTSVQPLATSSPLTASRTPTLAREVVKPGSDTFVAQGTLSARPRGPLANVTRDGEISLNLITASIPEAANAVLGEALGLNYAIEAGVEGQITLQTSTPLSRSALLEAFQTALEFNGFTLAESADLVTISPISSVAPRFVRLGEQLGIGRQIVIVPLKFVSTQEMLQLLEPIVGQDVILRVNENRNLLMVSGSQREIDTILEAVNLFDVDVLAGKSVGLIKLRAAAPDDIATELTLVFDAGEGGVLQDVVTFIPNQRLGSILVISSRQKYLREARAWIQQLDATASQSQRYPEVYELQNRTAEDLEPILSQLASSNAETEEFIEGDENFAEPEGEMTIIADDINNAIIAIGTANEQENVARLISRLDTIPTQVLLEATIAEVSLNDELDFGVRWFFESGNFSTAFSDIVTGAVVSSFPGFSFLFNAGGAQVALNALSSITDVKVVSSPSLLVLDNREAELRVGDQVPVATESAVGVGDPDSPIVNSITFRDTGVLLKVKPRVSESGRVIMDIEQEVSDVVETTSSGIDSPTISQRLVKTSVVVDSGQTLALGGLIRESESLNKTQVPVLGDIPVLGQAFKSKDTTEDRSELLILITPRVIRSAGEGQQITEEFRSRLSSPDQLLSNRTQTRRHQLQRIIN